MADLPVLVIGAGVIGLSAAVTLAEAGYAVIVRTAEPPAATTSYPHPGHVVLSGTAEPGKWNRDPDPATGHAILERCTRLEPRLADAQVIYHLVGLRPTRPYVRVDLQHHPSGATVAHNYGHGGAGVSLSWGCATEITDLISTATSPHR